MSDSQGNSLLQLVENDDHLQELCEFLDAGGNPNQKVHESDTLLHAAAQSNGLNERVIYTLIDAGADVDLTTSQGRTALQFAVISRNFGAVHALLLAGARINVQDNFGKTALHYAVDPGHLNRRSFHPMHDAGLWPYGMPTPAMWIIRRLLNHENTDINPVDSEGETPLMRAVRLELANVVKIFLDSGANPSIPNHRGRNCLHVALEAHSPNEYIITDLLLNGTGVSDVDNSGKTPIDVLFRNYPKTFRFNSVKSLLRLIAFKYRIRKDLECKVRKILSCFFI